MAKSVKAKATRKTGNRRVKRTVRRTIGALCMVSAITVAAIPVPENIAYNPANGEAMSTYGAADKDGDFTLSDLTLPNCNITNDYTATAYTIAQSSNGDWQLDWQFRYYAPSSGADGYIKLYNSQYQVRNVALDYRVFSDYVNIRDADYDSFYNSTDKTIGIDVKAGSTVHHNVPNVLTLGHVYTLDVTDHTHDSNSWNTGTDENLKFYIDNRPSVYQTYKEAWDTAYAADHDTDPATVPVYPNAITSTYKDVYSTDAEQQQFLCNQLFGTGTDMTLEFVRERVYSASATPGVEEATGWNELRVPKLSAPPTTGTTINVGGRTYNFDSSGFLAGSSATLIGIEPRAFYGVTNVDTLSMADEIRYIGDEAFMNSFVQSVTVSKDATIGNRAFKNCNSLNSITIPKGVTAIGSEAFASTTVRTLDIPSTVTQIGDGAFYNCQKLQSVNFQDDGSVAQTLGKGVFFNCTGLNDVNFNAAQITALGYGCFAIDNTETGNLTTFDMPNYIVNGANIGPYLLANRLKLTDIYMPENLKGSADGGGDISSSFVSNCQNLRCVEFPDSASSATFDKTLFYDVTNPEFYVRGPKLNNQDVAKPRNCTWTALFNASSSDSGTTYKGSPVPYVYNENGKDYYEVCRDEDGNGTADYIMCIGQDGTLVSCTFPQGVTAHNIGTAATTPFTIPAQVGTITVQALGEGCFEDTSLTTGVKDYIEYLKIEDGSGITQLEDEVFKGAKELKGVDIGNSVSTIGNSTFEDCKKLTSVTIGENIADIGDSAFKGCTTLTEIHFDTPTNIDGFTVDKIGTDAFSTGSPKLTVFGEIGTNYGPFVWSMQNDNYVDAAQGIRVCYKTNSPSSLMVILDNKNGLPTLVDYPHYEDIDAAILSNPNPSNVEQDIINATKTITIPDGIKSVDVKGYIDGTSVSDTASANPTSYNNNKNVDLYLKDLKYFDTYKEFGLFNGYFGPTDDTGNYTDTRSYEWGDADEYYMGLLGKTSMAGTAIKAGNSSTLRYEGSNKETNPIGNDYVEAIIMNDVEYLPDLAFYNCEKLQLVALGDNMEDVGNLPIADCTALASIGSGTDKYSAENGILYENKANGNKKMVEVFPGRGETVGSRTVNDANDPGIDSVDEIAEGAFSDCDIITFVELEGIKASTIPKYCFYDCDNLREVDLPTAINEDIEDNAFGKDPGIHVKAESKEVYLSPDAFGDITNAESPIYEIYRGSASEKPSQRLGANKVAAELKYIGEKWTVTFYNYDGTEILYKTEVEDGGTAVAPPDEDIPVREGWTFVGWSKSLRGIHEDTFVIAVYNPNSNTSPGVTGGVLDPTQAAASGMVTSSPGNTTKGGGSSSTKYNLTVVYGSGSGQYPADTKVIIEAIDAPAGKVFDKWVVTGAAATVYSSTSKATTVTTAAGDSIITATYKDASSGSGSSGGSGSGSKAGSSGTYSRTGANGSPAAGTGSSTRVDITKPGISDVDKAYASVSGSTDSFVVKITESADAANQVATALANKYGDMTPIKYFAMDISLYDATGTNRITDTTGLKVNVTMPIPDALRQYAGNNKVGAVVNGTQLEDLACKFTTVDGIPCISFTATHFSPYTIYVDTNNLQVGLMDSSPKTGDPIHPKWFVTIALAATSLFLFLKRDKVAIPVKA